MHKQLLGVFHHFGILLEQLFPQVDLAPQPGINPIDLPIENKGVNYAENQLNDNPQIVTPRVIGTRHLNQGLDDRCRLEIGRNHIIFLVGTEQRLLVVGEISDQRRNKERKIGKEDNAHFELRVREDQREESGQDHSRTQNNETDPPIEIAEYGNNLVDFLLIVVEQGLVKYIADRRTDTQLREIQKPQEILQGSGQTHEISTQTIQKDLAREETQCQRQEIEDQIDTGIQQRFFYAGLMNYLLFHQFSNIKELLQRTPFTTHPSKRHVVPRIDIILNQDSCFGTNISGASGLQDSL